MLLGDAFGAALAVVVLEAVIEQQAAPNLFEAALGVLQTLGVGLLFGGVRRPHWPTPLRSTPHSIGPALALALALGTVLITYAVTDGFRHESGLLAAAAMGVALANQRWVKIDAITEFKEILSPLLSAADALVDAAELATPAAATAASRFVTDMNLGGQLGHPANLVISNVPGPRDTIYFEGAELQQYVPVSTVNEGMGLNITVHSYRDRLDFGLIAARELIPDLWEMVDLHIDEIARLFDATGAGWVEPQEPPPMRRDW